MCANIVLCAKHPLVKATARFCLAPHCSECTNFMADNARMLTRAASASLACFCLILVVLSHFVELWTGLARFLFPYLGV